MATGSLSRNQVLSVKDVKYNTFYKAKTAKFDKDQQELKVHYIRWNQQYDEVLPMSSARIGNARRDAKVASSVEDGGGYMQGAFEC